MDPRSCGETERQMEALLSAHTLEASMELAIVSRQLAEAQATAKVRHASAAARRTLF